MATTNKTRATFEVNTKKSAQHDGQSNMDSIKFISATGKGTISSTLKNYAADPFFLKKAAEAKAELDRVGLPKRKK